MKKSNVITLVFAASLMVLFTQCKSGSKASSSSGNGTSGSNSNTAVSNAGASGANSNTNMKTEDDKKKVYRLVVSFISIGSGINNEVLQKVDAYIENHSKKPVVDKIRWGREGEVDYGFMLRELSTKEQDEFVTEVKKLIGRTDLVKVKENSTRD